VSPAVPVAAGWDRLAGLWSRRRPAVMGILNCTPDSFSDGGRFLDPAAAVDHAEAMLDAGADVVDVGGESTRPGAGELAAAAELARVLPVISELHRRRPAVLISVDTRRAEVAEAALAAGAAIVNDVSAGADPAMLPLVARRRAAIVLMHMRGTPRTMQLETAYDHVVAEVHEMLRQRAAAALAAGLPADAVWLDPGIGFGKDTAGNLALLAALPDLATIGHPVLLGSSRKSFIGRITGAPTGERLAGTLATLEPALACPRAVVRVHEPGPVLQYLEVAARLREAGP
jgi:dihydropteroate synthase